MIKTGLNTFEAPAWSKANTDLLDILKSVANFVLYQVTVEPDHPTWGEVTFCSPSYNKIVDATGNATIMDFFNSVCPSEADEAIMRDFNSAENAAPMEQLVQAKRAKNQGYEWLMVHSSPMFNENGICTHFNGIMVDITESHKKLMAAEEANRLLQQKVDKRTIELEQANARLMQANAELKRLASIDGLTGLYNRFAFREHAKKEIKRCHRHGNPLTLLFIDADNFKKINDSKGHEAGDTALKNLARTISDQIRQSDYAGRWGGEEFVVTLTECGLDGAEIVGERIRLATHRQGVTVSIGLAQLQPSDDLDALAKRADSAMYRAKTAGKNRLVCAR